MPLQRWDLHSSTSLRLGEIRIPRIPRSESGHCEQLAPETSLFAEDRPFPCLGEPQLRGRHYGLCTYPLEVLGTHTLPPSTRNGPSGAGDSRATKPTATYWPLARIAFVVQSASS